MKQEPGQKRIAVFIDYESLFYGLVDKHRTKPFEIGAIEQLSQIACEYGHITRIDAFADFEDNDDLKNDMTRLRSKGVNPHHVSKIKRKSYTDFVMLDSIYRTVLEDNINAFLIVTGDGHFAPCLGYINNRLRQQVIVAGVRGTVSSQLFDASSRVIELPLLSTEGSLIGIQHSKETLKGLIQLLDEGESRYPVIAFGRSVEAAVKKGLGTRDLMVECLNELIEEGAVDRYERENEGKTYRLIRLNRGHKLVLEALGM